MIFISKRDIGMTYVGLSSEDKPTDADDGVQFFESDTGKTYTKCGDTWYEGSPYISRSGSDGDDGDSVFIRYSASATGESMTETWSEGQNYMGVMTGSAASTDPDDYQWILFKGAAGTGATVVQVTGQSTDDVMSQKAATDNFALKTEFEAIGLSVVDGALCVTYNT